MAESEPPPPPSIWKQFEGFIDELPFGKPVRDFVYEEGKGVKRGWVAVLLIAIVAFWFGIDRGERSADTQLLEAKDKLIDAKDENTKVSRANDNLIRDNQTLTQRITSLEQTVSPLLVRAAKEFPGEEINASLKKIVEQLDIDPMSKPIVSATATATVWVLTDKPKGNQLGSGGFIAFAKGGGVLLAGGTAQLLGHEIEKGRAQYRLVCQVQIDSLYMGRSGFSLLDAEYIQVNFNSLEEDTEILGGEVVWVVNNTEKLSFKMPPQKGVGGNFYIRDLSDGFKSLKEASLGKSQTQAVK